MSQLDEFDCISNCPYCFGETEFIESILDRVKYQCAECGYCGAEFSDGGGDYDQRTACPDVQA